MNKHGLSSSIITKYNISFIYSFTHSLLIHSFILLFIFCFVNHLLGETNAENTDEDNPEKPVASQLVPGTSWCVVWTGTGKEFFFNPTTRLSVWEIPEELKDNEKLDKMIKNGPPNKQESELCLKIVLCE